MTTESPVSGKVSESFDDVLSRVEGRGPFTKTIPRVIVFFLQPLLGALPHRVKKDLERAVGYPLFFHTASASGLNILANMVLYPLILVVAVAALMGVETLFSQRVNIYLLIGLLFGFVEGLYRLREGVFQGKPAEEMSFAAAFYGVLLSSAVQSLLRRQAGILRSSSVPLDGFYARGFADKIERERRYGNAYSLEDWGNAYYLRLEFPRKVPEIGLSARSEVPDEMPDYNYSLVLKDGHFVIKGRCSDERIRKMSSSMAAFPPEFTTVIPLPEEVFGFSHRFGNKLLEVLLLKKSFKGGATAVR